MTDSNLVLAILVVGLELLTVLALAGMVLLWWRTLRDGYVFKAWMDRMQSELQTVDDTLTEFMKAVGVPEDEEEEYDGRN